MKNENCLFCKILDGTLPSRKIWEDENHIAVLTPYPNTPGFTVLITKEHHDSYIFALAPVVQANLFRAASEVAKLLDTKLKCKRTGLVVEGMGVNHAHAKLIPMHGIPDGDWQPILSNVRTFSETYKGFLSSHDGLQDTDENLDAIFRRIIN